MKLEAVLGLPEALEIVSGDVADQVITLTVISTQLNPRCVGEVLPVSIAITVAN